MIWFQSSERLPSREDGTKAEGEVLTWVDPEGPCAQAHEYMVTNWDSVVRYPEVYSAWQPIQPCPPASGQFAPRKGGDAPCPSTLKDSPGSSGKPTSSTPAAADVCQGCGEYYYECSCQSAPVEAWRDLGPDEQPREGDRLLCVEDGQVRTATICVDYSQKGFWQRRVTQPIHEKGK